MPYDKNILGEEVIDKTIENEKILEKEPITETKQEIIEKTNTTTNEVVVSEKDEYKESILENQKFLENMAEQAAEVLESSKECAINIAKPSDVESFSILLKNMAELQEKIVAIKEKRLKKPEVKASGSDNAPRNVTQNNIIIKSTRELNNILRNISAENLEKQEADKTENKTAETVTEDK